VPELEPPGISASTESIEAITPLKPFVFPSLGILPEPTSVNAGVEASKSSPGLLVPPYFKAEMTREEMYEELLAAYDNSDRFYPLLEIPEESSVSSRRLSRTMSHESMLAPSKAPHVKQSHSISTASPELVDPVSGKPTNLTVDTIVAQLRKLRAAESPTTSILFSDFPSPADTLSLHTKPAADTTTPADSAISMDSLMHLPPPPAPLDVTKAPKKTVSFESLKPTTYIPPPTPPPSKSPKSTPTQMPLSHPAERTPNPTDSPASPYPSEPISRTISAPSHALAPPPRSRHRKVASESGGNGIGIGNRNNNEVVAQPSLSKPLPPSPPGLEVGAFTTNGSGGGGDGKRSDRDKVGEREREREKTSMGRVKRGGYTLSLFPRVG